MFNPLNCPVCLEFPNYFSETGSWHGHIPFTFAIVSLLKSKILVELGVRHQGFKGDKSNLLIILRKILVRRTK
jgi:hypothetical protein